MPFNAKTWNIIWYDAINVESVNSNRDSFAIQDLPQWSGIENSIRKLFLAEEAYSHGGLRTRDLGQSWNWEFNPEIVWIKLRHCKRAKKIWKNLLIVVFCTFFLFLLSFQKTWTLERYFLYFIWSLTVANMCGSFLYVRNHQGLYVNPTIQAHLL